MQYLVDTNIVSETIKKSPNQNVINWLLENSEALYISSITIEEMRFGQMLMNKGKRRNAITKMIDELETFYSNRILSFRASEATECARLHAEAILCGRTPAIEDLMIASIANMNKMTLVTRNIRDFDYLNIKLLNPFEINN